MKYTTSDVVSGKSWHHMFIIGLPMDQIPQFCSNLRVNISLTSVIPVFGCLSKVADKLKMTYYMHCSNLSFA